MNKLDALVNKIKNTPQEIEFKEIIDSIEVHYLYSPTLFSNGITSDCIINQAKENEGSCKIFSFAQLHQLSEEQTLNCFGHYYRDEVLNYPDESNHGNIRAFIKHGWANINFESTALVAKA